VKQLILSDQTPIRAGREKRVYLHPEQPGSLVKIINSDWLAFMYRNWPFQSRLRRVAHYFLYLNELIEHISLRARGLEELHFAQNITGLVDTDLGLGIVVEAVTRSDGSLAESLRDLIFRGAFGEVEYQALVKFCNWLGSSGLIIRDLGAQNIVWNEKTQNFVIVDGFGERALLSLRMFSRRYNQRHNMRKAEKLLQRTLQALSWDPTHNSGDSEISRQ
jgi:hypothetical protein